MKILVLGGGGREHSLCVKIAQSPLCDALYCAAGNGGIGGVAELVELAPDDAPAIVAFAREREIDLVVIGPEAPLVAGVSDALAEAGIAVFGPSAAAAQLEASKGFTKALCAAHNIPTAAYGYFETAAEAHHYLASQSLPIVVKADGLAAGKGVVIAETQAEARGAIDAIFADTTQGAVVIEEFMEGEEVSFFALCDGTRALPLATAQDHKRAFDGDSGPNTGGMGAYSPAPIMTADLQARVMDEIIAPTLEAMRARGAPYCGVLYAGLMLTAEGPKLVEYNVRFGDPECQVLMMRLASDIVPALLAVAEGNLEGVALEWHNDAALTVVMATKGYPNAYEKGSAIGGLDEARGAGVEIFHAGTVLEDGQFRANGGRVLNVTARGENIIEARERAYRAVSQIDWAEGFYRRDIGWRAVEREAKKH